MATMIQLEGMDNCRKLHGLKLIRSGELDGGTDEDFKILLGHGVRTVFDLRTSVEYITCDGASTFSSYFETVICNDMELKDLLSDTNEDGGDEEDEKNDDGGIEGGEKKKDDADKTNTKYDEGDVKNKDSGEEEIDENIGGEKDHVKKSDSDRHHINEDTDDKQEEKRHYRYSISWYESKSFLGEAFRRLSLFSKVRVIWCYLVNDRSTAKQKIRCIVGDTVINPLGLLGYYKYTIEFCGDRIQPSKYRTCKCIFYLPEL